LSRGESRGKSLIKQGTHSKILPLGQRIRPGLQRACLGHQDTGFGVLGVLSRALCLLRHSWNLAVDHRTIRLNCSFLAVLFPNALLWITLVTEFS
jgi:hypothetical protein